MRDGHELRFNVLSACFQSEGILHNYKMCSFGLSKSYGNDVQVENGSLSFEGKMNHVHPSQNSMKSTASPRNSYWKWIRSMVGDVCHFVFIFLRTRIWKWPLFAADVQTFRLISLSEDKALHYGNFPESTDDNCIPLSTAYLLVQQNLHKYNFNDPFIWGSSIIIMICHISFSVFQNLFVFKFGRHGALFICLVAFRYH